MDIKAVIFDLDGVLVSTDDMHRRAWEKLAKRLGIPFDDETNRKLLGLSRMESLDIILGGRPFTAEQKQELAEEKNQSYRELISQMTPADVSFDVLLTLNTLKAQGFLTAIGSSSKNAPVIVEKTSLGRFFDAIADGNCITRSKPDPEVFLKAAEMLEISPENSMVIEDAEAGIAAARAGGFYCASIGQAAKMQLGDFKLDKLSDILGIV